MTAEDVVPMYESVATLTSKMAFAAQAGDFAELEKLKGQCAQEASAAASGVPELEGSQRLRKIELLKQIMANDRAIRKVTEPWHEQLEQIARPAFCCRGQCAAK